MGIAALTELQRKVLVKGKETKVDNKTKREESQSARDKRENEAALSSRISVVVENTPAALERLKLEFSLSKSLAWKLPSPQPTSAQEMIKLKEAQLIDPRNGIVSLRLVMVHEKLGQWKKAREVFKNYLKFVPDCAAHRFELGRVLFEFCKSKEALEEIKSGDTNIFPKKG